MRILWLSHLIPYPPKGGVLQRAYYLLTEVAQHHDVDLLAFNQKELVGPLFSSVEEGVKTARNVLALTCDTVEFFPIPAEKTRHGKYALALRSVFTEDPYTTNWLKSPFFAKRLVEVLKSRHYDLVHFDTISLAPYFRTVVDLPTVLDHHNIESHMLHRRASNEINIVKKWYFRQEGERLEMIEKQICPRFSLNITCSEIDRDRLMRIAPGSRVEEVPNGVDIEYFKRDESIQQEMSLIFVGTLSWYPNIEAVRFIAGKLWPTLRKAIPGISVDIIGANPPEDIRRLAEEDGDFRVHGFVDDVRPYLNKAAVYVCPIMDGGGTKLKVLDALSMEKAMVAHPIACEGIRVQDGKNVFFAESVDEYIEKVKALLQDEVLRREVGREARRLIEQQYSIDKVGKVLCDMYTNCVRSFRRRSEN